MDSVNKSSTVAVHTFGCKVNSYDSSLIEKQLAGLQFSRPIHVLNTCAVTAKATEDAIRLARRMRRDQKDAFIVMTGCSAQVDSEAVQAVADVVVANSHKDDLVTIVKDVLGADLSTRAPLFKSNIFKKESFLPGGGTDSRHTRAFVKIQDGCDSFCTFCVIPFARGRSRSLNVNDLVAHVQGLVTGGAGEIVLTGVHIGDYVDDGGLRLEDLIEAILVQTSVQRLRLSSLEPIELSDQLLDFYSDERMCRHFHMSIQSAQTKVLRDMKRKYTSTDVETSLRAIAQRYPDAFVGMDVIAGFPGETDEEFCEGLERLRALPWTRLHVFPYSRRPGTFAARRSDEVASPVKAFRATQLRELSRNRHLEMANRQIGSLKQALVLKGGLQGLSRDYWNLKWRNEHVVGTEVEARVVDLECLSGQEPVLISEPVAGLAIS